RRRAASCRRSVLGSGPAQRASCRRSPLVARASLLLGRFAATCGRHALFPPRGEEKKSKGELARHVRAQRIRRSDGHGRLAPHESPSRRHPPCPFAVTRWCCSHWRSSDSPRCPPPASPPEE